MADEARSTVSELRDAFTRTKNALKKAEQKTEQSVGVIVRATVTNGSALIAGLVHERFGKMDDKLGAKILRVGGVNVGYVGLGLGLGCELLEAGGKYSEWVGAAGNGVGSQASGDTGRIIQRGLAKNASERDAQKKAAADKAETAATAETKAA